MNSYVIRTTAGHVVVIDGGTANDAAYLRGFLAPLGNRVDMWFITHPHTDHMGALSTILSAPGDLKIDTIYHSPMTVTQLATDSARMKLAEKYHIALAASGIPTVNLDKPGLTKYLDELHLEVLQVNDTTTLINAYNNASIVLRLSDSHKSLLMLADAGEESGDRLLANVPIEKLSCDYVQMAHHGQQGVRYSFYRAIRFRACLWPTPLWVWDNNIGKGYNTAWMKTPETRALMDSLRITEHYCAWKGLMKIE